MALIKCSECGKDISDKANLCPNCGLKIFRWTLVKKIAAGVTVAMALLVAIAINDGGRTYWKYKAGAPCRDAITLAALQKDQLASFESLLRLDEVTRIGNMAYVHGRGELWDQLGNGVKRKMAFTCRFNINGQRLALTSVDIE